MRSVYAGMALAGALLASVGSANAVCPVPLGSATACIEITINPDGSISTTNLGNPVYDGIEDTLVNVTNLSTTPLTSLFLSAPPLPEAIFGFDGDGAGIPFYSPTGPFGPTGYEGPGTSFSGIAGDQLSGFVNFAGAGLGLGQSAWFSLEGVVDINTLNVPGPLAGAGLPGLLLASGGLLGWWRRRRQAA